MARGARARTLGLAGRYKNRTMSPTAAMITPAAPIMRQVRRDSICAICCVKRSPSSTKSALVARCTYAPFKLAFRFVIRAGVVDIFLPLYIARIGAKLTARASCGN